MTVTCTNVHYYDVDWETVNPKFGLEIKEVIPGYFGRVGTIKKVRNHEYYVSEESREMDKSRVIKN